MGFDQGGLQVVECLPEGALDRAYDAELVESGEGSVERVDKTFGSDQDLGHGKVGRIFGNNRFNSILQLLNFVISLRGNLSPEVAF